MNRMIQRSKRNLRNRKGFTLIELIVVIVIIGILAAIIIPRLSGFSDTAEAKADLATARTIYSAVAVAIAQNPDFNGTEINDLPAGLLESNPNVDGKVFTYSVESTSGGGIEVYLGGIEVYPDDER